MSETQMNPSTDDFAALLNETLGEDQPLEGTVVPRQKSLALKMILRSLTLASRPKAVSH